MVAGHHEQLRAAGADEAGQALGAARARDDAHVHFGQADACALGSEANVARERHLEAAAQAEAVDSGDDGNAALLDAGVQAVALDAAMVRAHDVHLDLALDVATGAEGLAVAAGQHDDADLGILLVRVEQVVQVVHDVLIDGVQLLRPVQRDDAHAVALFGQGRLQLSFCHNETPFL